MSFHRGSTPWTCRIATKVRKVFIHQPSKRMKNLYLSLNFSLIQKKRNKQPENRRKSAAMIGYKSGFPIKQKRTTKNANHFIISSLHPNKSNIRYLSLLYDPTTEYQIVLQPFSPCPLINRLDCLVVYSQMGDCD